MTAYQLAQRLTKALKAEFPDDEIVCWNAEEHGNWTGYDTTAPAIVWEGGPYEWPIVLTGWDGDCLADEGEFKLDTSERVRTAYKAIRENGFYCEPGNGFMLGIYRI